MTPYGNKHKVCVCVCDLKCHNEYSFYVEPNKNKLAKATGDSQNIF